MGKSGTQPPHFEGEEALQHVIEKRVQGVAAKTEIHGEEVPGHISAAADTARDMAILLLLIWAILPQLQLAREHLLLLLAGISAGWLAWKVGRSAWIGWSRLERLHRLIEQERYEIEHHRGQEREELVAMYQLKGFEGQLLDDVVDVLMADQDRLLRVMLEEELGLTLEVYEHPLKQAAGALLGGVGALGLAFVGLFLWPAYGICLATALSLALGSYLTAAFADNRLLPAIVWNLALGALAYGIAHYVVALILVGRLYG